MTPDQRWPPRALRGCTPLGLALLGTPQARSQTRNEKTRAVSGVRVDEPIARAADPCNTDCEAKLTVDDTC